MKIDELPLVTIGVPTFNRPEGLRRTLDRITKQTYTNLQIIVSDNCSPDERVEQVMQEFRERDSRIQYVRHSQNRGSSFNFKFVLEQAGGRYFMWAADDDYFESSNLVEKLLEAAQNNVLAFPDVNLSAHGETFSHNLLQKVYGNCRDDYDYLLAWCDQGWGYPLYGLYNLEEFEKHGCEFKFDEDFSYYNEGTFLHKLFLTGGVKFVPDVYINFDTQAQRPDALTALKSFTSYTRRTLLIHLRSKAKLRKKLGALRIILKGYSRYEIGLFLSASKEFGKRKVMRYSLANPIVLILVSPLICRLRLRIQPTLD